MLPKPTGPESSIVPSPPSVPPSPDAASVEGPPSPDWLPEPRPPSTCAAAEGMPSPTPEGVEAPSATPEGVEPASLDVIVAATGTGTHEASPSGTHAPSAGGRAVSAEQAALAVAMQKSTPSAFTAGIVPQERVSWRSPPEKNQTAQTDTAAQNGPRSKG